MVLPVVPDGIQVYDEPPKAVSVAEFPAHKGLAELPIRMLGGGLTVSASVSVLLQFPLKPVTV